MSASAGIIVKKDSLYVDHLNRVLSALQTSGIMSHLFTKDVLLKWLHMKKPKTTQKVLELRTYYSSLMFLGVMLVVSTFVFCVEELHLTKRKGHKKQRKPKVAK